MKLYEHQKAVIGKIKNGSILCGGVGSGKSLTSLIYYYLIVCGGRLRLNDIGEFGSVKRPYDLYIITTAKKRDSKEWEQEAAKIGLFKDFRLNPNKTFLVIDSWNNIGKYIDVRNSFFIFDEQRVIGNGAWTKAFNKITKFNKWILLTATPGDVWTDYIPTFIANGFYKNRSEFSREHLIFNPRVQFPQIIGYRNERRLEEHRNDILVIMDYKKNTIAHDEIIKVDYDEELYSVGFKDRWNPYTNEPVQEVSGLCYLLRRIVNSDLKRMYALEQLLKKHSKVIIFYNFNFELDLFRELLERLKIIYAEWNGRKHQEIPRADKWVYLVHYAAGAEGWNCIETNVIIFYSPSYSYKTMIQAAGRIDRLNTTYRDLYYYHLRSDAPIEKAIVKCLKNKKDFNEKRWING